MSYTRSSSFTFGNKKFEKKFSANAKIKFPKTQFSLNKLFSDPSSWSLIIANLVTLFIALKEQWSFANVIWIYWAQSIIIGFFQFLKILDLKKFSTQNFTINNQPVEPTPKTKKFTAFFFLFHYNFFHFIYLIFLASFGVIGDFFNVFLIVSLFFLNHLFSYLTNRQEDSLKVKNIGKVMFQPYGRIIPMHFMIIFGLFLFPSSQLVLFLGLKTIADLIMHLNEHNPPPQIKALVEVSN